LNLCFLWPTRFHNPNGKSIGSVIFAQLTAVSSSMPGHVLSSNNCPFARRIWALYNTCFVEPTRVHNPNGISIGSAVFAQITRQSVAILYNGTPLPLKIAHSHGRTSTPSNTWFPTHPSPQTKRHLDRFSRFCRAYYCDRQTTLLGQ